MRFRYEVLVMPMLFSMRALWCRTSKHHPGLELAFCVAMTRTKSSAVDKSQSVSKNQQTVKPFAVLIEASLEELAEWDFDDGGLLGSYASALKDYLQGNLTGLLENLEIVRGLQSSSPYEKKQINLIALMIELRLQIRTGKNGLKIQQTLFDRLGTCPEFDGEILWLLALCAEISKDDKKAAACYLKAQQALQKSGSVKKSLKAQLNFIATTSRLNKAKRLTADYSFLYKKALRARVHGVAGMALVNLALEYEKLGAYQAALKWLNRSLALLRHEEGGRDYFIALSHRSFINFKIGYVNEAVLDFEECLAHSLLDIAGPLKILAPLLNRASLGEMTALEKEQHLPYSWQMRLSSGKIVQPVSTNEKPKNVMTRLESKLVEAVSQGPKTKFELIETLYGDRIDLAAAENRLSNLINRFRKNWPKTLIFENGRYTILEASRQTLQVV